MHSKNKNKGFMIHDNADDIVDTLFSETSFKTSK